MSSKILALTPGDPDGIGPEITWKAAQQARAVWGRNPILCVGARAPFERLGARIYSAEIQRLTPPKDRRPHIWLLEAPKSAPKPSLLLPGYQAGWSIQKAVELVQARVCSALVTGPIHKERFNRGGFSYSGHTDFLAALTSPKQKKPAAVTMMLANDLLRVSLVTTHCSLASVPKKITPALLSQTVEHTLAGLQQLWKIRRPRVWVAALNPHAGESGLFGDEEQKVIAPTLRRLQKKWKARAELVGPIPADTLFAKHLALPPRLRADAVVCLYHDQGLAPVKLLDFPNTVNLTLGLPLIRTSVDHGTAFDIAGKNRADPRSLISAIRLASRFIKKGQPL